MTDSNLSLDNTTVHGVIVPVEDEAAGQRLAQQVKAERSSYVRSGESVELVIEILNEVGARSLKEKLEQKDAYNTAGSVRLDSIDEPQSELVSEILGPSTKESDVAPPAFENPQDKVQRDATPDTHGFSP